MFIRTTIVSIIVCIGVQCTIFDEFHLHELISKDVYNLSINISAASSLRYLV
jgi:hypothetical protein